MIATMAASNGQRVSSTSSLWMFWTVLKPISGRKRPKAMRPASAPSRSARATSIRVADEGASAAISDLLHVRAAEDALRQENHRDGKDGEGGDVLVVGGDIGRPHGLDRSEERREGNERRG